MTKTLKDEHITELQSLMESNDATGQPSFLLRSHWKESGYSLLAKRGLVTWGDPPMGFGRKQWAGATITDAGRKVLEGRSLGAAK